MSFSTPRRATRARGVLVATALASQLWAPDGAGQSATPPAAVSDAEARRHFGIGVALYDQGDLEGALAEFRRAYDLGHRPSVLFNLSATLRRLHRYPEAIETLERFLAQPDARPGERLRASRALSALRGLTGSVRLHVTPDGAIVVLDGTVVDLATRNEVVVGPGTHRIEASAPGRRDARADVLVASGEHRDVDLVLDALPPPPAPVTAPTASLAPQRPPDATQAVSSRPAEPPPSTVLSIVGAPDRATVSIDAQRVPVTPAIRFAPGPHRVSIEAPGMRAWTGQLEFPDGARTLRVALARDRMGPPPGWFRATAVATAITGAGWITFAALTASTSADFERRTQSDPAVGEIADRGRAFAAMADGLGIATLSLGVASVILFVVTEFRPQPSTAVLMGRVTGDATGALVRVVF